MLIYIFTYINDRKRILTWRRLSHEFKTEAEKKYLKTYKHTIVQSWYKNYQMPYSSYPWLSKKNETCREHVYKDADHNAIVKMMNGETMDNYHPILEQFLWRDSGSSKFSIPDFMVTPKMSDKCMCAIIIKFMERYGYIEKDDQLAIVYLHILSQINLPAFEGKSKFVEPLERLYTGGSIREVIPFIRGRTVPFKFVEEYKDIVREKIMKLYDINKEKLMFGTCSFNYKGNQCRSCNLPGDIFCPRHINKGKEIIMRRFRCDPKSDAEIDRIWKLIIRASESLEELSQYDIEPKELNEFKLFLSLQKSIDNIIT